MSIQIHIKYKYKFSFVETPRKFIIAMLVIITKMLDFVYFI